MKTTLPSDPVMAAFELSTLANSAAIELDNYCVGKNIGLEYTKELARIFRTYQPKDGDYSLYGSFPYNPPLANTVRQGSDKEIRHITELPLEMKLLTMELDNPTKNMNTAEMLRDVLVTFSKECMNHAYRYGQKVA